MMQLDHIEHADVMDYLRGLPDQCVNLVVTSPPYFGLRDYGTAEWEGGDANCDHTISATDADNKAVFSERVTRGERTHCRKCGARRIDRQIGLEPTPAAYIARMVDVFREAKRVLRDDGNCYVNLGDSYGSSGGDTHTGFNARWSGTGLDGGKQARTAETFPKGAKSIGLPAKSLMLIPHRFAIAMQDDGWLLREDIVWQKPNPMPESVRDRCTRSHEYIFHFTKQPRYWYDKDAVAEDSTPDMQRRAALGHTRGANGKVDSGRNDGDSLRGLAAMEITATGRNRRSVWTINPASFREAHFATFPEDIPEICIKAACPEGGVVLDPFMGAGTVGLVAKRLNRRYIGCDLNAEYVEMARRRVDSIPYTLFSLMTAST